MIEENSPTTDLVPAFYALMEESEIRKDSYNLKSDDIAQLQKYAALFGIKISQWCDGQTLIAIALSEPDRLSTAQETAALDILCSIAKTPNGLPSSSLSTCPIAQELLANNWIVLKNNHYLLSKRTKIEKATVLTAKTEVDTCSFCTFLNNEGNLPHPECAKFINTQTHSASTPTQPQ
ncbi:hypothetical protein NEHOM01_0573 [Nematocida homosporus]|uniref:uncharacterized protein n=1 Tax=Nematocida homosporus TaxID=1912981 RepID=UPI00221E86E9|nr:uncharacterized protein NEHOM01_0573 [Nematocida homosporus]KAI5185068.1 hypothetical protein NEHOM01_0573 [Nematocida homosporus]